MSRRAACRIPDDVHHQTKRHLALDTLDEPADTGLRSAVVVAGAAYGANSDFRCGLEDRSLAYELKARAEMTARCQDEEPHQLAHGGLGRRPLPRAWPLLLCEHVPAARWGGVSLGARARKGR
ncbi:transposase [Kitasatospora sp. NPDC096147]|uniref:transposase n=1 Tax=Kitasatospora sp. NPDC096147 TaxID=3364093 RepID=UPI00382D3675